MQSTFNEWQQICVSTFVAADPMLIDAPLSTRGQLQASVLRANIEADNSNNKIQAILTSPLTRAIQTTIGVLRGADIPIIGKFLEASCDVGHVPEELADPFLSEANIDCPTWIGIGGWMKRSFRDAYQTVNFHPTP
ncbi:hypothetical protein P3T76_013742 [Phytophthora citrophthora]|uniref:Uncharacterized protein n=1 Tax=Phytophthora citrophthora TaxID=4793 RepID=A0AAD9LBY8_9STRA|nr:hypothetical protein P3T76_013742 [Phytophthora citrophthora]